MQSNAVLSSKDNVNIKRYQKLAASKKARQADGLFVLEGGRLIGGALLEHARLDCLMITENAVEKYPALLAQADLKEVRLLVISNELGARIAQTEQPQGVFAVCRMPRQAERPAAAAPAHHLSVPDDAPAHGAHSLCGSLPGQRQGLFHIPFLLRLHEISSLPYEIWHICPNSPYICKVGGTLP